MATSIENFDGRHEHPSLYAINYKSYSNDNEKKKAADDITEKMAISVEAVYKKITSLRTQYSRLVKARQWCKDLSFGRS